MTRTLMAGTLATLAVSASAQVVIPGADGSDGPFNPTANITVNLALADTVSFADFEAGVNPNPGEGVYIPEQWAIVFRYSSVNVPSNVTVSFLNHPATPPVIWLVDGAVNIDGTVSADNDAFAVGLGFALPGPGGFRGSFLQLVGGLGPGGGSNGQGAVYGGAQFSAGTYGNSRCLPLIGGSGGAYVVAGGGCPYLIGYGGAGAILIAATDTISLAGIVRANATWSGLCVHPGSGGAVRLVCNRLEGNGSISATGGGSGGPGRIRLECNELAFGSVGNPVASFGLPGATATIWPGTEAPRVAVLSFGGQNSPADPRASFEFPNADINTSSAAPQTLVIQCENIPIGPDPQAWHVYARIVPRLTGVQPTTVDAIYVSGDYFLSLWHAEVTLPNGFSAIQVRAAMPPQ